VKFLKTILFSAAIVCAGPAFTQTAINLSAINADPDAPVEITSENLNVEQSTGTAVFQGNVVVGQGDLVLSTDRLEVIRGETTGDISRLLASGGVTFVTPTEAAESSTADYDLEVGTLVMRGNVLLTQGTSAISGDTMHVDLNTGAAQMEGNVRTLFNQGEN